MWGKCPRWILLLNGKGHHLKMSQLCGSTARADGRMSGCTMYCELRGKEAYQVMVSDIASDTKQVADNSFAIGPDV